MGRLRLLGAALAMALLLPASALAADTTIDVGPGKVLTPPSATISRGDSVTWHWPAVDKHHIVSDLSTGPEVWDSTERETGDFAHIFNTAGAFAYHCMVHPVEMRGTITVPNARPTASIAASTTAPASGASVTFDATGSGDSDGTIADYSWDLDGDGSYERTSGTTATIAHAFTGPAAPTVAVRVTDNDSAVATAVVVLNVAAPAAPQDPPPAQQPAPTTTDAAPLVTQAPAVPAALASGAIATPATGPSFSAPKGQRLKRQKGVKVSAACPGGCRVVFTGTVKVGAKKLKLTRLTRTLGAGRSAVVTLKVSDLGALRTARGRAKATIKATSTSGGQPATKTITVNLL